METLLDFYSDDILGQIGCFDRVIISGSIIPFNYAQGMAGFLFSKGIKIFDFKKFAEPFRASIRNTASQQAKQNNLSIVHVNSYKIRKEKIVSDILEERGMDPGLVCILSAMEQCSTYIPWHNKKTHKTYLKYSTAKCLHYYYYFIDELLGLMYVRIPTWLPCRIQVYFNGHNMLANKLQKANINFHMLDNCFDHIDDFTKDSIVAWENFVRS